MKKFQPIKFQGIEDLFSFLPKDELELTRILRSLVLECIPEVREKLSYNVPYYSLHQRICFIWPGSVPWGTTAPGVSFGFCNGNLLRDEPGYLDRGTRKQVYTRRFYTQEEIDRDLLRAYLFEAAEIDERLKN